MKPRTVCFQRVRTSRPEVERSKTAVTVDEAPGGRAFAIRIPRAFRYVPVRVEFVDRAVHWVNRVARLPALARHGAALRVRVVGVRRTTLHGAVAAVVLVEGEDQIVRAIG